MGKKVSKDFLSSYLVEIQNLYLLMNQLSWLKNRDKLSQVEQTNVFLKENILFIISHHDIVYLSEWNLYLSHVMCQDEPFFFLQDTFSIHSGFTWGTCICMCILLHVCSWYQWSCLVYQFTTTKIWNTQRPNYTSK